jgi:hypothetical protein
MTRPKAEATFISAQDYTPSMEVLQEATVIEREPWEDTLSDLANKPGTTVRVPRSGDLKRSRVVNAFQDAFELIGGTPRLAIWADENPTEFYRLYSKLMPKESTTESTGTTTIRHILPRGKLD